MPVNAGFGHFWLDLSFAELREAVSLAEQLLIDHAQDFEARIAELLPQVPEEQLEKLGSFVLGERRYISDTLAQILRRALFLVCYSRIEGLLTNLCLAADARDMLETKLGSPRHIHFSEARRHLTSIPDVGCPSEAHWQVMDRFRVLRNCIIHAQGQPSDIKGRDKPSLIQFVDVNPFLELDEHGYVLISKGFCEEVIQTAREFFHQFPRGLIIDARQRWNYPGRSRNAAHPTEGGTIL